MKILVISMHPAPYRDPILKYLKKIYGRRLEILTLYPDQTTHKEWELNPAPYEYRTLNRPVSVLGRDFHKDVFGFLKRGRYTTVFVCGYMPWTMLAVYIWCKRHKIKIIYCADTTAERYGSKRLNDVNGLLGLHADALYVPGKAARELWESKGVPAERIFEGMYTLDWEEVKRSRCSGKSGQVKRLLEQTKGRFTYLFIGHFIRTRNALNLVKAFHCLEKAVDNVSLIMVGKGEDWEAVVRYIEENDLQNVHVVDGLPFSEIHSLYARCDAYVHPGREPYSVSVQEAAFAGMRIVCTSEVGAVPDLVKSGVNGIVVPNRDIARLCGAMEQIRSYRVAPAFAEQLCRDRGIEFAQKQVVAAIEYVQGTDLFN